MVPPCVIDAMANAAYNFGQMVTPCVIDAVANAAYDFGEMAERSNAAVSKTVVLQSWDRGFESPSLRKAKLLPQPAAGFLFLELSKRSLRKGQK